MAQASKLNYHVLQNTSLPYVSNSSPLSTDPQYISGSYDILTNLKGLAEKRPGFSASLETTATAFSAANRIYFFNKWAVGSTEQYYVMFCQLSGGVAKVYKLAIGTDASAVLIFTSSVSTPFDFVFSNNTCYFGNGTEMKKFLAASTSDTNVYNWGIAAQPGVPGVSLGGTGISASVGYIYRTTGYNSTTGHESSPSGISACTGTFTNNTVTVTWTDPADTQADYVKVYKTLDGGSTDPTEMKLIATVARGVGTYADSTWDNTALFGVTDTAPQENYNDPPPATRGFVWSQGRIWGFANGSTWFTGYEEITNGVPEECCPGGTLGVFGGGDVYNWPSQVNAHAAMSDGVAVFLGKDIWKIEGDSLDTFRRYKLAAKRGAVQHTAVTSLGNSVVWLDTANQIWSSDLGEIGLPIRPDLVNIDQTQAYLTVHISNDQHWIVLLDGANGVLYVFDLDTQRWMPPWNVGSTGTALISGEISASATVLAFARNGTKAVKLVSNTWQDDGTDYAGALRTGMLWIAAAQDMNDRSNPEWRGQVDNVELKTGTDLCDTVKQLNDDDPAYATYTEITATSENNLDVPQGTYIKLTRYPSAPTTNVGRMTSIDMTWNAANQKFSLYQIAIAYQLRGA